jgi:hypothetical protein
MSVVEGTIPEQRVSEGRVFPLVYVPASPEHNSAQILNTWISEYVLTINHLSLFVRRDRVWA